MKRSLKFSDDVIWRRIARTTLAATCDRATRDLVMPVDQQVEQRVRDALLYCMDIEVWSYDPD